MANGNHEEMITKEQFDQGIGVLSKEMDTKLEALSKSMDAKLEALSKEVEALGAKMSSELLALGGRMQGLEKQMELEARYNRLIQGLFLLVLAPVMWNAITRLFS